MKTTLIFATLALTAPLANAQLGFKVPSGFKVTLYADDALATDIYALTFDSKGRVVVASRNYVKTLHDTDGDGQADKATLFSELPKSGAKGMVFDGPDLIANGDMGIRRYSDTDGDGVADKVSQSWLPTAGDREHGTNGIVRGPDGWLYMIAGNDAGIGPNYATTSTSPIRKPNSGAVVRFSPDGKKSEIVAHGFRNPYDLAFGPLGHIFTVDSDGERIHHLPYYTPTRLFDVGQGRHHGWILPGWVSSWARPQVWPDNVERTVEIGRGSPTGVYVYRHRTFPARYRQGVFSLCWTFGRVYFFPLENDGATFTGKLETFMETTGDVGFAPTDMAVGPDGAMYVSIGGRGTRGAVFRIQHEGDQQPSLPTSALRAILAADEPSSSWSRAKWVPEAKRFGKESFEKAILDGSIPAAERIRAVEILTESFDGVSVELARDVLDLRTDDDLKARVMWSIGRVNQNPVTFEAVSRGALPGRPRTERAAWEALGAWSTNWPEVDASLPEFGLLSPERRVRAAARHALAGPGRASFDAAYSPTSPMPIRLAKLWLDGLKPGEADKYVATCAEALGHASFDFQMEAIRLLQIAWGDVTPDAKERVFIGYQGTAAPIDAKKSLALAERVVKNFPSADDDLDREMARLLGMMGVEVPGLLEKLAAKWTATSSEEDDIHYLLVSARLPGTRPADLSKKTAAVLGGVVLKLASKGARPADQVPGILESLFDRLMERDPNLAQAMVDNPKFGAPGHELFALRLPKSLQPAGTRRILAELGKLDEDAALAAWSPELIRLVQSLPEGESLPLLRAKANDPRLADTIALVLAERKLPDDLPRLAKALNSSQAKVVSTVARALSDSNAKPASTDLGAAIRALRRFTGPNDVAVRQSLHQLLASWTGQTFEATDAGRWSDWLLKTYPKEGPELLGMSGASTATWLKRFPKVDWDQGNETRGQVVFQKKNCFRCHGDQRRLGPDLEGIAQRFSRDDLFVAIVDPSKDIAPAFQPTTIVTQSGKIHTGMLIYQSQELTLLQTSPDTTVRVPGSEVQTVQPGRVSFMPTGLLDDANDRDLADLYAYMRGLRKK